ncbi:MAG TPA: diadenylate cyclase CdaA [Phycisphaerae bacterium]|nr:diadenylate cyclase CdaA [Phycisphaerae bacterium]HNU46184.1 diadenylate cyclase CdaA [Phycisphaerae bacterium]
MRENPFTWLAQVGVLEEFRSFVQRAIDRPWVTLIELLLIGIVVFVVLRFLHGTRGARLVRAVLIILAVSFAVVRLVAERFAFDRINVLYPYFVLGVFLGSLVAFQAELRRLLMRVGEGGWFQWWTRPSGQVVEPLVTTVEWLATRKIGALIAIERTTQIGAVIESGIRLDARVSEELLETIFWPGTPLHDLGVIIRHDRVVAAGCQFPLAESGDVDRSLGSRHRAALGMSQEADAFVIVVSEETGTISVASRGRLRRGLTPEGLRDLLLAELAVPRKAGDKPETPKPAS